MQKYAQAVTIIALCDEQSVALSECKDQQQQDASETLFVREAIDASPVRDCGSDNRICFNGRPATRLEARIGRQRPAA